MDHVFDVAIVGGGIAGYTAALTLKNFRRDLLWIAASPFGGKLPLAETVKNFPSFSGSGKELQALLRAQCAREEVPFTEGRVDGVYSAEDGFMVTCGETSYSARAVILATGVETHKIEGEEEFLGRGVSYCAVCDGALYRNRRIAAVLESPAFEEEVEYLASFATEVLAFPLYKRAKFHAGNIRVAEGVPLAIFGLTRVTALQTTVKKYAVDAVFLLKTSAPPAKLVRGLETEGGHVKVARDMSTNIGGLFAAGDVTGRPYQYAKAAGEGLVAAFSANEYLSRAAQGELS